MPGIIQIDDINQSQALMGNNDEHLKTIEDNFDVVIHARLSLIHISEPTRPY